MTRLELVTVGKIKSRDVMAASKDYEKRLGHYFRFGVTEVDGAGLPDARADDAREKEAIAIERVLNDDLELIALTRDGRPWSTRKLADYLGDLLDYGRPGATFVIGGAHGLAPRLIQRAKARLSLSSMTLPHELARLVLTEQLYRAGTVIRGEPYHKGP